MNTNPNSKWKVCDGGSVNELLWVIITITIVIPLLSIFLGANDTQLKRELDGILVREMVIDNNGSMAKVNLRLPFPKFDSLLNIERGKKNRLPVQTVEEGAIGYLSPEFESSLPATDFTFADLDETLISAQIKEVSSIALTLPAARGVIDSNGDNFFEISPVCDHQNNDVKKSSVLPSLKNASSQFQSAEDFVASLIKEAY